MTDIPNQQCHQTATIVQEDGTVLLVLSEVLSINYCGHSKFPVVSGSQLAVAFVVSQLVNPTLM